MKNKLELTAEIKYKLLRNISHKIQGTLDLDKILNLLLDMLANIIDYDAAGIFILSADINHPGYHQTRQKIASMVQRGFGNLLLESDAMQIPSQSYSISEKVFKYPFRAITQTKHFLFNSEEKSRFLWFDKFYVDYPYGDY